MYNGIITKQELNTISFFYKLYVLRSIQENRNRCTSKDIYAHVNQPKLGHKLFIGIGIKGRRTKDIYAQKNTTE